MEAATDDRLMRLDIDVILTNQHDSGAYVASPTFSQYPFGWLRDGSFIAHAMDAVGEAESAARFHAWVSRAVEQHRSQLERVVAHGRAGGHPDEREFLPARFALDGTWHDDGWPAFQLDGYGQWLWSLERHAGVSGALAPQALEAARAVADYLIAFRLEPCYDAWEEGRTQLHTSTLASVAAGLLAAQRLLGGAYGDAGDEIRRFMARECVAVPGGDTEAAYFVKQVGRRAVDASVLWLATPFDLWPLSDPRIVATMRRVERELVSEGGVRRYAGDTFYGGGAWILLTAWLGWHYARAGRWREAAEKLAWVDARRDDAGHLPEQVPVSSTHPHFLRYWTERWGSTASPLLWSHAMRVLLAMALDARGAD